MSMVQ